MFHHLKLILIILCLSFLNACGSGGGNENNTDKNTQTPLQNPPSANSGPNQEVLIGTPVLLSGANSTDADGDQLSYLWTLASTPVDSKSYINNATSITPSFVPDQAGEYVVTLIVNDGMSDSQISTTVYSVLSQENNTPIANAGASQNTTTDSIVNLNGSLSHDPDNDPISYSWVFSSIPDGSTTTMIDAQTATPFFTADINGTYIVSLTVNDGATDSNIAQVIITSSFLAKNNQPTAHAGTNQSAVTGILVSLDGSKSNDADNDSLTYSWNLNSIPSGSSATLFDTNTITPYFTPDLDGAYVISLVVNDGQEDSLENLSVVVSSTAAANSPPFANSGPDSSAFTGNAYILNGSSSVDPDGDTLTYYWEALSGPQGTAAILFDTEAAITFFTPDIIGDYIFRLTVSDGVEDASSDVNITAINPPSTITDSNVHLFSTDSTNNIIYLGCWTCNQFDSNSIHNSFSNYGNSFSSLSIRNAFSTYGNPFSPKSACNTLGNDAPNLFDGIGEYYGRISTNQFSTDSICNTGSSFYSSVDCATLNTYCDN